MVRDYFRERYFIAARLVPFAVVRWLSRYDAALWFEPALAAGNAKTSRRRSHIRSTRRGLMFYRNVIAFDRLRQRMEISRLC